MVHPARFLASLASCAMFLIAACPSQSKLYIYIMMTGSETDVNGVNAGTTVVGRSPIIAGVGQSSTANNSSGLVYSRVGGLSTGGPLVRYGAQTVAAVGPVATWSPITPTSRPVGSVKFGTGTNYWLVGAEYEIISQVYDTATATYSDRIETERRDYAEVNHHVIFDYTRPGWANPINLLWCGPELADWLLPSGYGVNITDAEVGPTLNNAHWWYPSQPLATTGMPVVPATTSLPQVFTTPQLFLRVCIHFTTTAPTQEVLFAWVGSGTPSGTSQDGLKLTVPASSTLQRIDTVGTQLPANHNIVALVGHVHDHCEVYWLEKRTLVGGIWGAWVASSAPAQYPKNLVSLNSTHQKPDYTAPAVGTAGTWSSHRYSDLPTMYGGLIPNNGHLPAKGLSAYYPPTPITETVPTQYRMSAYYSNPHPTVIDGMALYGIYAY